MRPHAHVSVTLLLLAACAGGAQNEASPSPGATPGALRSCEIRQFSLDGADVIAQANVDGTPASITVVRAPNDDVRVKAFQDARKILGDPKPDTRTQTRQYKWGMIQVTDMCGRPVMPGAMDSPSPAPTSSATI